MTGGKSITFHEYGREYVWSIATGNVYTRTGLFIASHCFTLADARKAVTGRYRA